MKRNILVKAAALAAAVSMAIMPAMTVPAQETEMTSERNAQTEPDKSEVNGETEPEKNAEAEAFEGIGEGEIPGVPRIPENPAMEELCSTYIVPRLQMGETWVVSMEDMKSGVVQSFNEESQVLSASVIKVFIMATIYDKVCYPKDEESAVDYHESYEGELKSLLTAMITVSDNDAANRCIEICGGGDFHKGAQVINDFCHQHGYVNVHVGRRFLDPAPTDDNYISGKACRMLLSDLYHGKCVNEEADAKMIELLKGQQLRHKIPAGLPAGFTSGNKTGEMPLGYNLGCIENDIAIIFSPEYDYVLVVLSSDLEGRNDEADHVITQISAFTAAHLDALFTQDIEAETEDLSENALFEGPQEEETEKETAIA